MAGRHPSGHDKTRMCPYCRMQISAFATKCFHCGERVEPPRWDQRRFTTEDLGGMPGTTYAPSESVMAAIETFRAELEERRSSDSSSASDPDVQTDAGSSSGGVSSESGLPELDERSKVLASLYEEARPTGAFAQVYVQPQPSSGRRLSTLVAVIIVVAALGAGAVGLYSVVSARGAHVSIEAETSQPPPNPALGLLEEGKLLEALDAARSAVTRHDTGRNREIHAEVRDAVAAKIAAHINADPWHPEDLDEAVRLASGAAIRDPGPFFAELEQSVKREEYAYKMMLVRSESDGRRGTARFRLHPESEAARETGEGTVTVEIGEHIGGRFRLLRAERNRAEVEDLENGRRLAYSVDGRFVLVE